MRATFCDDRLRGLGVARGRIPRFPVDFRRRPYNTLSLPCECVRHGCRIEIRPLATPKPLNRSSQKVGHVITSWISTDMQNLVTMFTLASFFVRVLPTAYSLGP